MAYTKSIVSFSQNYSSPSSSKLDSMEDPFYLNPSDSPNSLLVSTPFTGDNYTEWCPSMMMALCAKNKLGFVNGTITKPCADADPASFSAWNRVDQMVMSWLVNSLHEDFVLRNVNANSAAQLWKDLSYRYSPDEGLRIFNMQNALATHKQENDSATIYYEKLKDIWYYSSIYLLPPPSCGCESTEKYFKVQNLMQFLRGLNENYDSLRRNILSMDPLPSVDNAYKLVLKEETHMGLSVLPFSSSSDQRYSYAALVRNAQSSISSHSLISPNKSTLHLDCAFCKLSNHTIDRCYKLYGYPQQLKDLFDSSPTEDRKMELQHFSHQHPLKFTRKNNKQILCSGCRLALANGPTYSCEKCSYVLHYLCAKLPRNMHDVAHKKHPLTLLLEAYNYNGEFVCCACASVGKGFHFYCATCQFSIDVHCALIPESLKHQSHQHPLSLKASNSATNCTACGLANEGVSFGCLDCKKKCNFELHVYCVTLPLTIKYKDHNHSLSLRCFYDPFEEHVSMSCDICRKELDQKFWYYGCNVCYKIAAHTDCAASMVVYGAVNKKERMQIRNCSQIELMKRNIMAGRIEECGQWYP